MQRFPLEPLSTLHFAVSSRTAEYERAEQRAVILKLGLSVLNEGSWKKLKCGLRNYAALLEDSDFIKTHTIPRNDGSGRGEVHIRFIADEQISAQYDQIISKYARHAKQRDNSTRTELQNMPEILKGLKLQNRAQDTASIYVNAQRKGLPSDPIGGLKNASLQSEHTPHRM